MTEQDRTPQLQPAPKYLRDFGSGPHHEPTDPAIYLATEPSAREMDLVAAIDRRHAGEPTPIIHTVKLALRVQSVEVQLVAASNAINGLAEVADPRTQQELKAKVAEVHGVYSKIRKWLYSAIGAAALGLTPTAYRLIDKSEAHGAELESLSDLKRSRDLHDSAIDALRKQLSEVELELARHPATRPPAGGGAYLVPPTATSLSAVAPFLKGTSP